MSTEGQSAELMSSIYVSPQDGPGPRSGVLGGLAMVIVFLMTAALFVVALLVILGLFIAASLVALTALGVDRVLVALSPKRRARRAAQGRFQPLGQVIATTARVIDSSKPRRH